MVYILLSDLLLILGHILLLIPSNTAGKQPGAVFPINTINCLDIYNNKTDEKTTQ